MRGAADVRGTYVITEKQILHEYRKVTYGKCLLRPALMKWHLNCIHSSIRAADTSKSHTFPYSVLLLLHIVGYFNVTSQTELLRRLWLIWSLSAKIFVFEEKQSKEKDQRRWSRTCKPFSLWFLAHYHFHHLHSETRHPCNDQKRKKSNGLGRKFLFWFLKRLFRTSIGHWALK